MKAALLDLKVTVAAFLAISLAWGVAHASAVVVPAPSTSTGIDWPTWIMLGLAALAGVRVIVDALLAFFKAEAPLTKSTIDDRIRDDLQLAHDKLDQLAGAVKSLTAPTKPPSIVPPAAAMLVVLLLGGLALVPACGGSQSSRANTIVTLDSGIQTATAALRTYEHEHAMAIIDAAPDKASGHASLVAFRAKVDKVWKVVDVARAAIDAANTVNDDTSLAGAQVALVNAIAAVTAITGGSP